MPAHTIINIAIPWLVMAPEAKIAKQQKNAAHRWIELGFK